jgi:ArsR family metal-binding transcriptional regulator
VLIGSYDLELGISTHSTQAFEYEVIAHLPVDIGPVLPYLNATLSRAIYAPQGPALSWRHEGHNIGFWPRRIAVDHVEGRDQVDAVIGRLIELVNRVWERRHEIEPDNRTHERLQPLELHRLLPRTNCKACGEATCFAFALKLAAGQIELARCTPLFDETPLEIQRTRLEALLSTRWPLL